MTRANYDGAFPKEWVSQVPAAAGAINAHPTLSNVIEAAFRDVPVRST